MTHDCPDCGTSFSTGTATVRDGTGEVTAEDAMHMVAQDGEQMKSVVLECDECGWSVARTITIRSI